MRNKGVKVFYSSFWIISKPVKDWPPGSPVVGSIVLHELYCGLLSVMQEERKRTVRGRLQREPQTECDQHIRLVLITYYRSGTVKVKKRAQKRAREKTKQLFPLFFHCNTYTYPAVTRCCSLLLWLSAALPTPVASVTGCKCQESTMFP